MIQYIKLFFSKDARISQDTPRFYIRITGVCLLLCTFLMLNGCQTINRTREQVHIPANVVIFTFDDGPNIHEETTARLLDVLKKHNIQAMFTLLGENAAQYPALVKRMHDEGHYIINHGYRDKFAVHMNKQVFYTNLMQGEAAIAAAQETVLYPRLYRPHGGFYKTRHQAVWEAEGYTVLYATARAYDAVSSEADKSNVIKSIIKAVEKYQGGIILLHDARGSSESMEAHISKNQRGPFNRSWIPDTVEEIIGILQEKGYILTGFDIALVLNIQQ
jgi:peptidoglycan/xylan/chitin deacetylase (PgdA/CDA1 family)